MPRRTYPMYAWYRVCVMHLRNLKNSLKYVNYLCFHEFTFYIVAAHES